VEVLQTSSQIKLPESTSEQQPRNRLVISVSHDDVVVQGRLVASVADLAGAGGNLIPALGEELAHQAGRRGTVPDGGHEITIMGDHELPYWLLKKIMYTCQSADFARISLAVNRMTPEAEA
jgi:biopolymer transport protein ExbD